MKEMRPTEEIINEACEVLNETTAMKEELIAELEQNKTLINTTRERIKESRDLINKMK